MLETIARPAMTVSSIVAGDLAPLAGRIDSEGIYPADILHRLGAAGAFAHHAISQGAPPTGIAGAADTMAEIGAVCLSTAFCTWCQDAFV